MTNQSQQTDTWLFRTGRWILFLSFVSYIGLSIFLPSARRCDALGGRYEVLFNECTKTTVTRISIDLAEPATP